ncbi:MAG: helix-turn-helix domain-containing protein [Bdellovibrionales bacterium]|nr:helix-turn-helix domain-containing protein [Bdellovibrionales bacterium]
MKKTGEILKKERERQEVSLNEISMATKISVRMLKAVEEGNLNDLPAKTFLRGFVKSYASQLKMDVDDVLETFHEEMGSTLVQTDAPTQDEPVRPVVTAAPEETVTKQSDEPSTESSAAAMPEFGELLKKYGVLSKLFYAGVLVALVFLIYGVRNVVIKYEKESQVEAPKDLKGLENTANTNQQSPEDQKPDAPEQTGQEDKANLVKAEADAKQQKPVADQPKPQLSPIQEKPKQIAEQKPQKPKQVEVPKEPEQPKETESTPKPEPQKVAEQKKPETSAQVKPKPEAESKPAPVPSTASNAFVDKNEIIIEALDNVEIEFRIGKGDLQRVNLNPDQVHTIKANAQVRIDFSDGGAVNITHNGRDRGVPGDLGKPKKVILP